MLIPKCPFNKLILNRLTGSMLDDPRFISGRVDDVLLASCDSRIVPAENDTNMAESEKSSLEEDDKPDLLQLIIDDDIKQFL